MCESTDVQIAAVGMKSGAGKSWRSEAKVLAETDGVFREAWGVGQCGQKCGQSVDAHGRVIGRSVERIESKAA